MNNLPPIQFGNLQLEQLAQIQTQSNDQAKAFELEQLQKVGDQFEQVFISMMLKQMRSSMSEEGLFAGDNGDVYGGMFDMFMSEAISSNSPLGIADAIKKYAKNSGLTDVISDAVSSPGETNTEQLPRDD